MDSPRRTPAPPIHLLVVHLPPRTLSPPARGARPRLRDAGVDVSDLGPRYQREQGKAERRWEVASSHRTVELETRLYLQTKVCAHTAYTCHYTSKPHQPFILARTPPFRHPQMHMNNEENRLVTPARHVGLCLPRFLFFLSFRFFFFLALLLSLITTTLTNCSMLQVQRATFADM
jgi:hypothetical protein